MNTASDTSCGGKRICPWWMAHTFDNLLRRLVHPAGKTLAPYVRQGMTALDIGCGFGHFTLGLARLVGDTGRVAAIDVQRRMLDKTMSRARQAGLGDRITPVLCDGVSLGVSLRADFVLASNVLHEVPNVPALLSEVFGLLRPGGMLYVMEPSWHVKAREFAAEMEAAEKAGFSLRERPTLFWETCAVLERPGEGGR